GQNLHTAYLISRTRNGLAGVGGDNIHHLKLPYDSRSVERDRRSNPGDDGINAGNILPFVMDTRFTLLDTNVTLTMIDDDTLMTSLRGSIHRSEEHTSELQSREN